MDRRCSILICTYNRAEVLDKTLASLCDSLDGVEGVEVIVVDNASSDGTRAVVERFSGVAYLHEAEPGLSVARNTAVRAAQSDKLIFIDDDVVVTAGWIRAYLNFFETMDAKVAFWGGDVRPYFEKPLPDELAKRMRYVSRAWSLIEHGSEEHRISSFETTLPIGANFGGRRDLFLEVPFDSALGRKAEVLTSGEEIAVLRTLISMGHTGAWVPGASLLHRVPPERTSRDYLKRFFYAHGRSTQRMNRRHSLGHLICGCGKYYLRVALMRMTDTHYYFSRGFARLHYYRGSLAEEWQCRFGRKAAD